MNYVERFWSKILKKAPDECWPWMAGRSGYGRGYGYFWYEGRMVKANRMVFFITHGYWPRNALHKCSMEDCCNPAHIFDGTQSENILQAKAEGRLHNPYVGYIK